MSAPAAEAPARAPSATAPGHAAPPGPLSPLRALWRERPLVVIVALAAGLRLAAALLSRGFAFHDDHFEVVEIAQRWLDGQRDWLGRADSYRSLVYPGLHWLLFRGLRGLGLDDPQGEMLVVRLLHAAWSMVTVVYGTRIAARLGGPDRARVAGLLLAAFWLAPFAAVHDLVEVVCQPPLVLAVWCLVRRGEEGPRGRDALVAGLWLGLAFTLRFQTLIVPAALGLVLLAQRRARAALLLGLGALLAAAALQGGSDWLGYGRPFSSLRAYLAYNGDPANVRRFPNGPWYQYLLTLLGVLVPPASAFLLAGALRSARRLPLLSAPVLLFVAAHSLYPGKQERFLLPVLPLLLVLCALGACALAEESPAWRRRPWLARGLWAWFWAANVLLLGLYTAHYSKRSRVEPLGFLRARGDARAVLVETVEPEGAFVPRFYLGSGTPVYALPATRSVAELRAELSAPGAPAPTYAVLTGERDLSARLERLRPICPRLAPLARFEPDLVDRLLHRLNPRHNVNLVAEVYRCD